LYGFWPLLPDETSSFTEKLQTSTFVENDNALFNQPLPPQETLTSHADPAIVLSVDPADTAMFKIPQMPSEKQQSADCNKMHVNLSKHEHSSATRCLACASEMPSLPTAVQINECKRPVLLH
jgi:hypothetical protein